MIPTAWSPSFAEPASFTCARRRPIQIGRTSFRPSRRLWPKAWGVPEPSWFSPTIYTCTVPPEADLSTRTFRTPPPARKGRARAQVANILMDAHESGQVEVTIGRASDFFGPRVTGSAFGERVFAAALQDGTVNVLGDATLPHTYTYIRDFAAALVTLAEATSKPMAKPGTSPTRRP